MNEPCPLNATDGRIHRCITGLSQRVPGCSLKFGQDRFVQQLIKFTVCRVMLSSDSVYAQALISL
jgi:hypothetical protein